MPALSKWMDAGQDELALELAHRTVTHRVAAICHSVAAASHTNGAECGSIQGVRVAARRADAALEIFRGCIRAKSLRQIRRPVRSLLATTQLPRDLDLLAARLMSFDIDRYPGIAFRAAADIEARSLQAREWLPRTEQQRQELIHWGQQLARSDAWLRDSHREPLLPFAVRELAGAASDFLQASTATLDTPRALRRLRQQCRRLRYTLEIFDGVFGYRLARGPYPVLQQLHRRLGAVQDQVATARMLRTLQSEAEVQDLPEFYELLLVEVERQQTAATEAVQAWWTSQRRSRVQKQLQRVLREGSSQRQPRSGLPTGGWLRKIVPTRKKKRAIA